MDQQVLIDDSQPVVKSFLKRLLHRFNYGDAPIDVDYLRESHTTTASFALPFDQHSGPLEVALENSKSMKRSLIVFIYSNEHVLTRPILTILRNPEIAEEIRNNFVFYPVLATTPEGFVLLQKMNLTGYPVLAVLQPKGNTLEEANVFLKYQGDISDSVILTSLRMDNNTNRTVVQEQDMEYAETERAQQQHEIEQNLMTEIQNAQRESITTKIEEDYASLAIPPEGSEAFTVRFDFPGNKSLRRKFLMDATISDMYKFARHHMKTMDISVVIPFPSQVLEDSDQKIASLIKDKNFIVHVDEL